MIEALKTAGAFLLLPLIIVIEVVIPVVAVLLAVLAVVWLARLIL